MCSSDWPGTGLMITQALRFGWKLHPLWLRDPPHTASYAIETFSIEDFLVDQGPGFTSFDEFRNLWTRQRDLIFCCCPARRTEQPRIGHKNSKNHETRKRLLHFASDCNSTQLCMLNQEFLHVLLWALISDLTRQLERSMGKLVDLASTGLAREPRPMT